MAGKILYNEADEFGYAVEKNILSFLQAQGTLPEDFTISHKEI